MIVTIDAIELFAPEHDRTSCSDDDPSNGLSSAYHHGRTAPRCTRCALLEIVLHEGGHVPEGFTLRGHVEYDPNP
jgi:hypothetical protein